MVTHSLDVLARVQPEVPPAVAARADAWSGVSVPPRRSASVVLLRDGEDGLEVYLLHRHARMAFAPSMVVFPGGGLEPVDERQAGHASGVDPLRAAAVRETEEETGVRLDPASLVDWAHWITPEVEPRRYDTRFFVAALPPGQQAADLSGETDRAGWAAPGATLAAAERGELSLMPPTRSILAELADYSRVAEVLTAGSGRRVEPVLPRLVRTATGWAFAYPRSVGSARLNSYLAVVLAPNPGPMTLTGTNTWIVGDPAQAPPLVIDPGPADPGHLDAVLDAAGGRIGGVVLTHWHEDHSEAAPVLADRTGCPVRAADPRFGRGPYGLEEGDLIETAGATLRVHATPGHTADSVSLLLTGADRVRRLLTGDTVLGRGTTVIMHPDGDLAAYLESLTRLSDLVAVEGVRELLPGHGPVVTDPAGWLAFYRAHRRERLDQVRAAWAAGCRTAAEVVARVYADVDRSLWPAAERSVAAQLEFLRATDGPSPDS